MIEDIDSLPPGELALMIGQDNLDQLNYLARTKPHCKDLLRTLALTMAMRARGLITQRKYTDTMKELILTLHTKGCDVQVRTH